MIYDIAVALIRRLDTNRTLAEVGIALSAAERWATSDLWSQLDGDNPRRVGREPERTPDAHT